MKKLSTATMLALVLALLLGGTVAYAAFHWCPDDPVFSIDGKEVNVLIELGVGEGQDPADIVTGPVHIKLYVPKGVDAGIIGPGDGFGHGEKIKIIHKGNLDDEIKVKVRVPTRERYPLRVTVTTPSGSDVSEGWSKRWVKCEVEL